MGAKFYAQGEEKFKERLMLSGIKDVVTSGQDSTHLIPELVKGRGLRDFLGLNNKKQLMQMKFKKGDMFQPHQEKKKKKKTRQLQPSGSGFCVKKNIGKGLWNLPRWLFVTRSVAGASLCSGLERPLCEAVKMKPGLCWRPQAMGYPPRRAANRMWNLEDICVGVNKV